MAGLSLEHIYKVYDGNVAAVNDFNMEIKDKEFIVFVGPSGCGKSTTLRMIAGLEEITSGILKIDDVIVNNLEPKDRNIAMVFQNYALYPHMTVYDNMAFALKNAKVPKNIIDLKINEAAEILGIKEYLKRKPKALSGGQRQRVALGRAIVRNPKVFLLDEPLSNLDAKLRAQMRTEITRLHEKLQTTFIYVTHDQIEAMTMGTRIVVMKDGYVQQIDTPQNLYKFPVNMFVAGFIGTPQMSFFDGEMEYISNSVKIRLDCKSNICFDIKQNCKIKEEFILSKRNVVVGFRSEDIKIYNSSFDGNEWAKMEVRAISAEQLGGETLVYANIELSLSSNIKGNLVFKVDSDYVIKRGDIIKIALNLNKIYIFDKATEANIKEY